MFNLLYKKYYLENNYLSFLKYLFVSIFILSFTTTIYSFNNKTKSGVEYPDREVFINDKEHSRITARCTKIKDDIGNISCTFNQITVSHLNTKIDEERIAGLKRKNDNETQKEINEMKNIFCSKNSLKNLESSFNFSSIDDMNMIMNDINMFCNNPSKNKLIKFYENAKKIDKLTCSIEEKSYKQDFKYDFNSERWIHQSEPKGDCGIIEISYIEKDPRENYSTFSWNYFIKSIATNKTKDPVFGSCNDFIDETDHFYYGKWSSQHETHQVMDCKYIAF